MTPIPPDTSRTRNELLTEARRLVYVTAGVPHVGITVHWVDGRAVAIRDRPEPHLPIVNTAEWWAGSDQLKAAALVALAESYLIADPDRQVRQRMRQVSQAISSGADWSTAAHHLVWAPHRTLAERRAELGPLARKIDPEAAARWVATGDSREAAA